MANTNQSFSEIPMSLAYKIYLLLNTTNVFSLISHSIFLQAPENPLLGVSAAFLTAAFVTIKLFS